jgi:dUTP pyrophosphatase
LHCCDEENSQHYDYTTQKILRIRVSFQFSFVFLLMSRKGEKRAKLSESGSSVIDYELGWMPIQEPFLPPLPTSSGWDLRCPYPKLNVWGQEVTSIPLNIAVQIPWGYYGRIAPRSSLSMEGITVMAGVVDADFRGNVSVLLGNINPAITYKTFKRGDKIAQLILEKILTPARCELVQLDALELTERGEGGFGSTGLNDTSS